MASTDCLHAFPLPRPVGPDDRDDPSTPTLLALVGEGAAPPADRPGGDRLPGSAGRAVRCRRCREPIVVGWAAVISSHRTSSATVTYLRCPCGGAGVLIDGARSA